ncbi:MAG: aldose 1-epimerase [bacterium]|nr:aldose 1-epimerase [bacterium]
MSFFTRTLQSASPAGGDSSGDPGGIETIEFVDSSQASQEFVVGRIAVGAGNTLCYFGEPSILGGRNLLHFPWQDLREYRDNRELGGNPLLYPWANRLAKEGFEFAGRRYDFPEQSGSQAAAASAELFWRDDHGLPLHGCLLKSDRWRTIAADPAGDAGARASAPGVATHVAEQIVDASHPAFACYPFAHCLRVEHRLDRDQAGCLRMRVRTTVENRGDVSLPLSFGYHPYFSYAGFERDAVRISLPAARCFETDAGLLPTGRLLATEDLWPARQSFALAAHDIDHGFTALELADGGGGVVQFRLTTPEHRVTVAFGRDYPVAVIYAPYDSDPGRQAAQEFVCFEPMLAPTNALGFDLSDSEWPSPPVLAPGDRFSAEFWITADAI